MSQHKELVVRIIRASDKPFILRPASEIQKDPLPTTRKRSHLHRTLHGSSIGALAGALLLALAIYFGLRPLTPEISALIGIPLALGALTGYVVL